MASERLRHVVQHLCGLAQSSSPAEETDGLLLERFGTRPTRMRSRPWCNGIAGWCSTFAGAALGNSHEAEDAFQATFLILVAQSSDVGSEQALGRLVVHRRLSHGAACPRRAIPCKCGNHSRTWTCLSPFVTTVPR